MVKYYKTRIKEYPDGTRHLTVYNNSIATDVSDPSANASAGVQKEITPEEIEHTKQRNLSKVKTKIRDYCLSNNFTFFWTITFEDNRYDYADAFDRMSRWLEKMRKKHGKFDYIMIPETHKDGAIHFHGVTGGFDGQIVDSGVKHKGAKVFNCPEWEYGFTTLTAIRSRKKCASYITKYFTKEMQNTIVGKGKKKYWCSRGLRLPAISYSECDLSLGLEPDYENDTCSIFIIE